MRYRNSERERERKREGEREKRGGTEKKERARDRKKTREKEKWAQCEKESRVWQTWVRNTPFAGEKKKKIMEDQVYIAMDRSGKIVDLSSWNRYERLIVVRKEKFCSCIRSWEVRRKKKCIISACNDKVDVWRTFWYFSSSNTFI